MQTVTVEDAQSHLVELIEQLPPGEEVVLTHDDKPVATIRAASPPAREAPNFGTLKGTILHIALDFDTVPEGFEDYFPMQKRLKMRSRTSSV